MKQKYLTKDKTYIIKGIAIILMVMHHFYAFKGWKLPNINFYIFSEHLNQKIGDFGKICVYIFSFLTGYSFYINREKLLNLEYRLKKIITILLDYWIILLFFLILAKIYGEPLPNIKNLILTMFGLNNSISLPFTNIIFGWYISFYIVVTFFSPIIINVFEKLNDRYYSFLITIFGIYILYGILDIIGFNDIFNFITQYLVQYASVLLMGYFMCKYDIFKLIKEKSIFKLRYLLYLFLLILIYYLFNHYLTINNFYMTIFYVPIFIFCVLEILETMKIKKILIFLGKNSFNIWLLHAIFFTPLRKFQFIAYLPKYDFLVIIWVLLILSILSIIFLKIQNIVKEKTINILFK